MEREKLIDLIGAFAENLELLAWKKNNKKIN